MKLWKCGAAALMTAALAAPALADPANVGKVIITEIFCNPNDNDSGGFGIGSAGDNLEYIEIFNTTNEPIDISGWFLDDEDPTSSVPFPPGTILGARQALVVIGARLGTLPNDPNNLGQYLPQTSIWTVDSFNAAWDPTPGDGSAPARNVLILPGNITIANTPTILNEVPFLVDRDGTVIDIANYQDAANGWPAVTAGVSISLRPQFLNSVDNDRGCAWYLSTLEPGSLTSAEVVFVFDPDGDGPGAPTARDRLADAGNVGSPGFVAQDIPPATDCNNNGISDVLETCSPTATAPDLNGNLLPDSCDPDTNGNGVPDDLDAINRELSDRNMNAIADFVEINTNGGTNGRGGTLDTNNNGEIDAGEAFFGRVIITEILVDPFTSASTSPEWVEIQNVSAGPVDISGYRLLDLETGGDGYTLPVPAGTVLQSGEIAVLATLPTGASSLGGAPYTADQARAAYEAIWGATTPQGTPIRWIPLGRWGARATNATASSENLTLVGGAVIDDAAVPANTSSTSGPHPISTNNTRLGPAGAWVQNRGFIVDQANYSNTNSNGEPLNNWPGADSHGSFYLRRAAGNFSAAGNNFGERWALSIPGLNGARISADLTGQPSAPFGFGNFGEDFGSPGFVPTADDQPSGEVIITEIAATTNSIYPGSNPVPPVTTPPQSVIAGRDEFVEIANVSAAPVDLTGWYLADEDGRTSPIPAGTILQPGEVAVIIGVDTFAPTGSNQPGILPLDNRNFVQEFFDAWGCGYKVIQLTDWYTDSGPRGLGRLADGPSFTNEILRIVRADGVPADIVNYDDDGTPTSIAGFPFGWPTDATAAVNLFWSIYALPGNYTAAGNDNGLVWAASLTGFDGGRQSVANATLDGAGFPAGLFNRSMFGTPGFVEGVTAPGVILPPGAGCVAPSPACNVADIVSIGGFPPADGELTVDDYTSFINAFAGDELLADIVAIGGFPPADGELTVDDYTSFINAFAEGCI